MPAAADVPPPPPLAPAGLAWGLIVTTGLTRGAELVSRALEVSRRTGAPYVERRGGIDRLLSQTGAELCYVVSHERDSIQDRGDPTLFVHPGLFYLKRSDGVEHPLIRAVAPVGEAPLERVIDGTLGLAGDALHLAAMLGCPVVGVEANPALCCLVEDGLKRLGAAERRKWAAAARRIEVTCGQAEAYLASQPDASADVVYLDPMFRQPLASQPGFGLLRRLADHRPPTDALFAQAWRVARRRVVLKIRGADPPPDAAPPGGWTRFERGQAVDYLVADRSLPPQGAPPRIRC